MEFIINYMNVSDAAFQYRQIAPGIDSRNIYLYLQLQTILLTDLYTYLFRFGHFMMISDFKVE